MMWCQKNPAVSCSQETRKKIKVKYSTDFHLGSKLTREVPRVSPLGALLLNMFERSETGMILNYKTCQ